MNELQVFTNKEFGSVRMTEVDGKPYFCGTDVARALGYGEPHKAVARHCNNDGMKRTPISDSLGRIQETVFISEGNLYRLIVSSKLPSAERFEKWIFDNVLPSIRKNGGYILNQENMSNEELLAKALLVTKKIIEDKDKEIERMKPKEIFFDTVADSKDAVDIGKAAKLLNFPNIGRNNLFSFLRNAGILMRDNVPYQKYVDAGYFRVIENSFVLESGDVKVNVKTLVYQRGLDYIRKLLSKENSL